MVVLKKLLGLMFTGETVQLFLYPLIGKQREEGLYL